MPAVQKANVFSSIMTGKTTTHLVYNCYMTSFHVRSSQIEGEREGRTAPLLELKTCFFESLHNYNCLDASKGVSPINPTSCFELDLSWN